LKSLLVTQRVDVIVDRGERRDALDQRMAAFVSVCGFLPVPVPNDPVMAGDLWSVCRPVGVVLTGGNDLASLGGNAPERDATEEALVVLAARDGLPVLGICRGFQFLAQRGGASLSRVEGHVARRHPVEGKVSREVNSYHGWAVTGCGDPWRVLATAPDGSIECGGVPSQRHWGLMWHPEREAQFAAEDVTLVREMLSDTPP
jgi:gamma-glutamyl-gamma-aminobutyrate hydrolase PuuD